jgi:hypothetical protein
VLLKGGAELGTERRYDTLEVRFEGICRHGSRPIIRLTLITR